MDLGQAYKEVLPESHRRALLEAANDLINTTIRDLGASDEPHWTNDNWLLGMQLPPRYTPYNTGEFARKFFMCLVTVVWKLGQAEIIHLSCVAEELATHVLIQEAEAYLEGHGIQPDFSAFYDAYFKDTDFEFLYDNKHDGIEQSEIAETMGFANLAFTDWFKRFGPPETDGYTEVHPYIVSSSIFPYSSWVDDGDDDDSHEDKNDESDTNTDTNLDGIG